MSEKAKVKQKEQFEKDKMYYKIFTTWRFFDFLQSVFSFIGLILAIYLYESDIEKIKEMDQKINEKYGKDIEFNKKDDFLEAIDSERFNRPGNHETRWIILLSSILSLICLIIRHTFKNKWQNKYFNRLGNDDKSLHFYYNSSIMSSLGSITSPKKFKLRTNKLTNKAFFFEVIVLLIFPYPGFEVYFPIVLYTNDDVNL